MSTLRTITIAGGGLAGLTLGIALRQRGVPVTLWEAGTYPRHRVCGEFISGRGQAVLENLGLLYLIAEATQVKATTAAFFVEHYTPLRRALPREALCISRHRLDAILATEFARLGGELRIASRWPRESYGDGVVRATGRRAQASTEGWRWFGLKVHATGMELEADVEMHLTRHGYVGLCRIGLETVNVCGLFRSAHAVPDLREQWPVWLKGSDTLAKRWKGAVIDEKSFCSVAAISLQPACAAERDELCVGDALTMIAPVTGNGMSMSFESAQLVLEPVLDYSAGRIDWAEARTRSARSCDRQFRRRLWWAARLQQALLNPRWRWPLLSASRCLPGAWRLGFACTR